MPFENNSQQVAAYIKQAQELLILATNLLGDGSEKIARASNQIKSKSPAATPSIASDLDYSMPLRAFLKKHSGGLTGAKKLTLLIAYLAKGDNAHSVAIADIESNWSTALMGSNFNRAYPTRARDNDWIDTSGSGLYQLRPNWKQIFN